MRVHQSTICLMLILSFLFSACSGTKPNTIGLKQNKLLTCPKSPNCVNSQDGSGYVKMDPISYSGTQEEAKTKLLKIINDSPRTTITENTANYIHVEFMTKVMRFVDDVEFYFDDANKKIHFRSASRKGHSDLNLNKKRMEGIIKAFK